MPDFDKESLKLGHSYPMADLGEYCKMKDRIIMEATILFSKKGYEAVSLKEIAMTTGHKAASLYNYFSSKEDLWSAVLDHVADLYLLYFARLDEAYKEAACFEDVLESMFVELKQVVNIFTYYGFSLVISESFREERAASIYNDIFLGYSIDYIAKRFDECVHRGWIPAFATKTVATFFMHSVLNGILLQVQKDMGREIPYDVVEEFSALQQFIDNVAHGRSSLANE